MANGHDDLICYEEKLAAKAVTQHVYHSWVEAKPHLNVKLVCNSKSTTWELTVLNAANVEEALALLQETETKMTAIYGNPKGE
jgi:hypothetical protein